MTGFAIDMYVDSSDLDHDIAILTERLSDVGLIGFMHAVVEPYLKTRIHSRFGSEGDDVSGGWAALSPATEEFRQHQGFPPSHPINQRTRMMRDFLVNSSADVKTVGAYVDLMHPGPSGSMSIEEKIKTAQQGKAHPSTVPRPVLGLNVNDEIFIIAYLAAYLQAGV